VQNAVNHIYYMRLKKILPKIILEDVDAEKRLELIADHIMKAIDDDFGSSTQSTTDEAGYVMLGKIKKIVPSSVMSNFFNRLGNITIEYHESNSDIDGDFNPQMKAITIALKIDQESNIGTPEAVHSVIVHELRHALDYSLSKGKGFNNKLSKYSSDVDSDQEDDNDGNYHRQNVEINARLSQASLLSKKLLITAMKSGEKIDNSKLKEIIFTSLDKYKLVHIFKSDNDIANMLKIFGRTIPHVTELTVPLDNKGYRKLVNRMLKYLQSTYDDLK